MADKKSREVIGGGRRRGKTTELIKRASREGLYILCPNRNMARSIFERAEDMGLDIPFPVTVEDLPLTSPHIKEVLVDESEMVLQQLIGKNVAGMSTSYKLNELPNFNNSPKKSKSVGSLHVDIDVTDALTGLKAVQREAKRATAALKELEEQKNALDPELYKRHYLCTWIDDEDLPTRPEISG